MLREKEVFHMEEIKVAFIEPNGNISFIKKSGFDSVKRYDLQLPEKENQIAYPVIIEGKIHTELLNQLGYSIKWLTEQIESRNIDFSSVFFASLTSDGKVHVSPEHTYQKVPDLLH
jgi:uncharacterized membrane protein YcaP (DUF421 family)